MSLVLIKVSIKFRLLESLAAWHLRVTYFTDLAQKIQVTLTGPGIAYICLGGFAVAVRSSSSLLLILVFLN